RVGQSRAARQGDAPVEEPLGGSGEEAAGAREGGLQVHRLPEVARLDVLGVERGHDIVRADLRAGVLAVEDDRGEPAVVLLVATPTLAAEDAHSRQVRQAGGVSFADGPAPGDEVV